MGKAARNRRRRLEQQQAWPGLDGRHPLTLPAARFEALVGPAFDHIMTAGTSQARLSLAACWALGVLTVNELDDDDPDASWAEDPSPAGLAFVGAVGSGPPGGTSVMLDAAADRWFHQLDAAGANDRIRAFSDTWDRVARHDNPHGHYEHFAFALALADEPLALEPLAARLMPHELLDADIDADSSYLPGASRRTPSAGSAQLQLGDDAATELRPMFDRLGDAADRAGLPADATIGDILEASGHTPGVERDLLAAAEMLAEISPASAHAFLATDGLLLTEMNEALVGEADARRWKEAGGAYQHLFARLDELAGLDHDDPDAEASMMDATFDAAATLLDELVALVDDGAMMAYDRLLEQVSEHPQGAEMREQVCSSAFTELTVDVDETSFEGDLGDDVRRLVGVRFADRDPGMPAAADRALAVADTLVDGDMPLSRAVGDEQRELHVWIVLLTAWRAATA